MKKLILFSSLLLLSSISYSQNWEPFPEDSLFFEPSESSIPGSSNPERSSYLVPLVKSGDSTNIFMKTNPEIEWSKISVLSPHFGSTNSINNYTLPIQNWLGKVQVDGSILSFITSSEDKINIDISQSLNFSDTIQMNTIVFAENLDLKLVSTIDSVWESGSDSLKSFSFNFLDSLNYTFHDSLIMNSSYYNLEYYWLGQQKLVWSKNNGIIQTPSFNFFPYCHEYKKLDKIKNILPITKPYSYDIFWNEIGDEIHTIKNIDFNNPQSYVRISKKIIVTNISYDSINQIIHKTYDSWSRIDTSHYDHISGNAYAGTKSILFEPNITDTIYLLDYSGLNEEIPNGLSPNSTFNLGYFYNNSTKQFIREMHYKNGYFQNNDSINIDFVIDSESRVDYYIPRTGGKFYQSFEWAENNYYRPRYTNFNGITTGTPFTDSFILSVQETELPTPFYIQNSTLFIDGFENQTFEAIRLYSISGQFIKTINSNQLETGIDISDLTTGIYFMIYKTNLATKRFKFVKE